MSRNRKGAKRVISNDPMHDFMPYIMGTRTENEALMNVTFDMTEVVNYLKKRNDENPEHHFTIFHIILAAMSKTIYLRPHLNRFIAGHTLYERDDISFTFTAKSKFADNGGEFVTMIKAEDNGESLIDQMHDKVVAEVYKIRSTSDDQNLTDGTSKMMALFNKIPRPVLRWVIRFLNWLDYHDWLPKAIKEVDPYQSTVFISNLGSIKLEATYHHLINWSINSLFVLANRMHKMPFFNDDGTYEMRDGMSMGFVIDERIADGFYFARSLVLFEQIIKHPELLEKPLSAPIDEWISDADWH